MRVYTNFRKIIHLSGFLFSYLVIEMTCYRIFRKDGYFRYGMLFTTQFVYYFKCSIYIYIYIYCKHRRYFVRDSDGYQKYLNFLALRWIYI